MPLGYIATRLERHQGHSARSPAAHFDEFVYSAQATLPQESDQLRLHCHSATSPLDWNATKAIAPEAQQLTLTSSSTLHRPRCLRSQTSSGYTATRLHRHSAGTPPRPQRPKPSSSLRRVRLLCTGHSALGVRPAQAILPPGYIATRLERHQGHNARSPVAHFDKFVYSAQATLPHESDQLRLHCHSATSPLGWNATKATVPGA